MRAHRRRVSFQEEQPLSVAVQQSHWQADETSSPHFPLLKEEQGNEWVTTILKNQLVLRSLM